MKLIADTAVSLPNVPGMHRMVYHTLLQQSFMIRPVELICRSCQSTLYLLVYLLCHQNLLTQSDSLFLIFTSAALIFAKSCNHHLSWSGAGNPHL